MVAHVHLHEAALHRWGVARVEELRPLLVEQLQGLFTGADIDLKPVIDLADQTRVTAYEHPDRRERPPAHHRRRVPPPPAPPAPSTSTTPSNTSATAPDAQTGDHNAAPLSRTGHRAKTHLPYTVRQLGPDDYVWRTPPPLPTRQRDRHPPLDPDEAEQLLADADLHRALDRIERQFLQAG